MMSFAELNVLQMQFKVRPYTPFVQMDNILKEKMKVVMSSKFDATSQHLNLSKFYANEGIMEFS